MPAYATTWDYREYGATAAIEESTTGRHSDGMIALALEEGSRHVEIECRRTFGPQVTTIRPDADTAEVQHPIVAATRTFYGRGTPHLRIDPCFGTLALQVGGEDVDTDDYRAVSTPRDGLSFYVLERLNGEVWRDGTGYDLTATFGCAETPPAIKHCVLEYAALRRIETRRAFGSLSEGEAQAATFGDSVVSLPAQRILDKYLRDYRLVRF